MRNSFDAEPRLMALTEAELAAQRASRTWMQRRSGFSPTLVGMNSDLQTRWSRHARSTSYWRIPEIARRLR